MKITYIHHSSFSVEFNHVTMLFDYYEGPLPDFDRSRPLMVFASHFHGDHFAPVIFDLAEGREDIQYVLSKDINKKKVPEHLLDKVMFVKAGEKYTLYPGKNEKAEEGGNAEPDGVTMEIETFKSTDEGVAFWISCEGKEIYHAGDLNNWWWEGEDKAWNYNMAANYAKEMDKMTGRTADAAFIPLDPRLEQWFYLGMKEFMEKADAKAVIPMHFWKDYSIIEKMRQHPSSEGWRERLIEIHREGEELDI